MSGREGGRQKWLSISTRHSLIEETWRLKKERRLAVAFLDRQIAAIEKLLTEPCPCEPEWADRWTQR